MELCRYFTDGSVDPGSNLVGGAFLIPSLNYRFGFRLHNFSSVLTAALYAIFCAVKFVLEKGVLMPTIFVDSYSALVCIWDRFTKPLCCPLANSVVHLILRVCKLGLSVGLSWVPVHYGLGGNEIADSIVEYASSLPF